MGSTLKLKKYRREDDVVCLPQILLISGLSAEVQNSISSGIRLGENTRWTCVNTA
jgi:hypothetical protein